jgi:hypothetical protein
MSSSLNLEKEKKYHYVIFSLPSGVKRTLTDAQVPEEVRSRIQRLLAFYRNGVYEADFASAYLNMYSARLNVREYGFRDLRSFVEAMYFATADEVTFTVGNRRTTARVLRPELLDDGGAQPEAAAAAQEAHPGWVK